jgi:hypothetical protein
MIVPASRLWWWFTLHNRKISVLQSCKKVPNRSCRVDMCHYITKKNAVTHFSIMVISLQKLIISSVTNKCITENKMRRVGRGKCWNRECSTSTATCINDHYFLQCTNAHRSSLAKLAWWTQNRLKYTMVSFAMTSKSSLKYIKAHFLVISWCT